MRRKCLHLEALKVSETQNRPSSTFIIPFPTPIQVLKPEVEETKMEDRVATPASC
jgi:hypothetical protein